MDGRPDTASRFARTIASLPGADRVAAVDRVVAARLASVAPLMLLVLLLSGCPAGRGTLGDTVPLDKQIRIIRMSLSSDADSLISLTSELLSAPPDDDQLVRVLAVAEAAVAAAPGYRTRWRAARAASYTGQHHSKHAVRLAAVQRGIDHARAAREIAPDKVGGYHYGAVNLGLLARLEPEGALSRLEEVVRLAEKARSIDPSFEQGGPLRTLGALYTQAPPWPTSVGDIEEAEEVLTELVGTYPDYPLNHFFLGEAMVKLGNYDRATKAFEAVLRYPPRHIWRLEGPHFRALARQRLADIHRLKALR